LSSIRKINGVRGKIVDCSFNKDIIRIGSFKKYLSFISIDSLALEFAFKDRSMVGFSIGKLDISGIEGIKNMWFRNVDFIGIIKEKVSLCLIPLFECT
jgi:hypothetical protein